MADSARKILGALHETRAKGQLPPEIVGLEIGVGTGARAASWLDKFKALDAEAGTGYYDRDALPPRRLLADQPRARRWRRWSTTRGHVQRRAARRAEPVQGARRLPVQDHVRPLDQHLRQPAVRRHRAPRRQAVPGRGAAVSQRRRGRQAGRRVRLRLARSCPARSSGCSTADRTPVFPTSAAWRSGARSGTRSSSRSGCARSTSATTRTCRPACSRTHLEDLLAEAPRRRALPPLARRGESFANTAAAAAPARLSRGAGHLRHRHGRLPQGFRGPGKLDGSLVTWVNGALLRAVGARAGYDVHFAPFPYRPGTEDHRFSTPRSAINATRGMTAMSLPILPDHRHRQLLDARLARARQERLPVSAGSAATTSTRCTTRCARRRSRTRKSPASTSSPTARLQRDNMIDYFTERHARRAGRSRVEALLLRLLRERRALEAGHRLARPARRSALPEAVHRSARRRSRSRARTRWSSGIRNEFYPSRGSVRARSGARDELRADASWCATGVTQLQIDEPYYSGFPEDLPWAIKAINALVDGVKRQHHAAHLLRQPLRQAVVRGQLPVSVPGDARGQRPGGVAGVRAPRRRGPAAVQGIQGAVHARAWASSTSRRRTSSRRR